MLGTIKTVVDNQMQYNMNYDYRGPAVMLLHTVTKLVKDTPIQASVESEVL